jgi:hypothetical protein
MKTGERRKMRWLTPEEAGLSREPLFKPMRKEGERELSKTPAGRIGNLLKNPVDGYLARQFDNSLKSYRKETDRPDDAVPGVSAPSGVLPNRAVKSGRPASSPVPSRSLYDRAKVFTTLPGFDPNYTENRRKEAVIAALQPWNQAGHPRAAGKVDEVKAARRADPNAPRFAKRKGIVGGMADVFDVLAGEAPGQVGALGALGAIRPLTRFLPGPAGLALNIGAGLFGAATAKSGADALTADIFGDDVLRQQQEAIARIRQENPYGYPILTAAAGAPFGVGIPRTVGEGLTGAGFGAGMEAVSQFLQGEPFDPLKALIGAGSGTFLSRDTPLAERMMDGAERISRARLSRQTPPAPTVPSRNFASSVTPPAPPAPQPAPVASARTISPAHQALIDSGVITLPAFVPPPGITKIPPKVPSRANVPLSEEYIETLPDGTRVVWFPQTEEGQLAHVAYNNGMTPEQLRAEMTRTGNPLGYYRAGVGPEGRIPEQNGVPAARVPLSGDATSDAEGVKPLPPDVPDRAAFISALTSTSVMGEDAAARLYDRTYNPTPNSLKAATPEEVRAITGAIPRQKSEAAVRQGLLERATEGRYSVLLGYDRARFGSYSARYPDSLVPPLFASGGTGLLESDYYGDSFGTVSTSNFTSELSKRIGYGADTALIGVGGMEQAVSTPQFASAWFWENVDEIFGGTNYSGPRNPNASFQNLVAATRASMVEASQKKIQPIISREQGKAKERGRTLRSDEIAAITALNAIPFPPVETLEQYHDWLLGLPMTDRRSVMLSLGKPDMMRTHGVVPWQDVMAGYVDPRYANEKRLPTGSVVAVSSFDRRRPMATPMPEGIIPHGSYNEVLLGYGIGVAPNSSANARTHVIRDEHGNVVPNAFTGQPLVAGSQNDWNLVTQTLRPFDLTVPQVTRLLEAMYGQNAQQPLDEEAAILFNNRPVRTGGNATLRDAAATPEILSRDRKLLRDLDRRLATPGAAAVQNAAMGVRVNAGNTGGVGVSSPDPGADSRNRDSGRGVSPPQPATPPTEPPQGQATPPAPSALPETPPPLKPSDSETIIGMNLGRLPPLFRAPVARANVPRSFPSSLDLSDPLRQRVLLSFAEPRKARRATIPLFRAPQSVNYG